jgi:hypothetical protein
MRKKRPILWTGLAVCLILAGAVAAYKPWRDTALLIGLLFYSDVTKPNDPLTRSIRDTPTGWGEPVALTPEPLKSGMAKVQVEQVLTDGKFKPTENRDFSWRNPRIFPSDSLFYSKSVDGLPCGLNYTVVVRYDDRQTLVAAVGTENEAGCL